MTLKARILSFNFVIAIFALVLAAVLFLNHSQDAREMRRFAKVSDLLLLFIRTSESFAEESAAGWAASPVFEDYTAEGVERFGATVETTDALVDQIGDTVAGMDLSAYDPRFRRLVTSELNFHERVDSIRDGLTSGRVEAWPSVQAYVSQIKWLIGIIPQLAIEAPDAELARKILVADAIMQLRLLTERHTGTIIHNLKYGEVSEMVFHSCQSYLEDARTLAQQIRANASPEGIDLFETAVDNADFETIVSSTHVLLDAGAIRYGIDPPHSFDASLAPLTQTARDEVLAGIGQLKDFILDDIASYTDQQLAEANWHQWQAVILGLLCLGVCLGSGFFLANSLSRTISQVARSLHDKANDGLRRSSQVARASKSLADGGSRQAASIQEISATMEQMKSISDANSDQVVEAQRLANETDATANRSAASMKEMALAMETIQESSDQISNIAKEIEEIAFQTNILALNAAVEAARAGEAGAGFAIVADEVRSLAQKSAVSATSTREKIEAAIESVDRGTRLSEAVQKELDAILAQSALFKSTLEQVGRSASQQNASIGQVTQSIAEIDAVTQDNAASSEETAGTAEEMRLQSESIIEQIESLERVLHGNESGSRQTARRPSPRGSSSPYPANRDASSSSRAVDRTRGRSSSRRAEQASSLWN